MVVLGRPVVPARLQRNDRFARPEDAIPAQSRRNGMARVSAPRRGPRAPGGSRARPGRSRGDVEVLGGAVAELVEDAADAGSARASSVTVTWAERRGMPLVIVQACRSWTSTTPGTPAGGAHVVEVEPLRRDLEQHRPPLPQQVQRPAAGSAPRSPARRSGRRARSRSDRITTPAATASTDPTRSANTSLAAPRRLSAPVSDAVQDHAATPRWRPGRPARTRPSAPASTGCGSASREMPAYAR